MADATLSQGHRLTELLLRENDPRGFLQTLLENWGAVQKIGRGEVDQATISQVAAHIVNVNPYASEKVQPRYFYPKGYQPSSVMDQAAQLLHELSWLDVSHVRELAASWQMEQYSQADGLYVVPKPSVLANRLGIADHWVNFGHLIEQAPLAALAKQRKFTNYRAGELGSDRYRLTASCKSALEVLEAQQPGDVLVFPAQTGALFAGFSVRNSRFEIEHATTPSQWSLDAYVVAWMVYCNRQRLEKYEDLIVDCPGGEYSSGAGDQFDDALYFDFYDGELYCHSGWTDDPDDGCGSASGFLR